MGTVKVKCDSSSEFYVAIITFVDDEVNVGFTSRRDKALMVSSTDWVFLKGYIFRGFQKAFPVGDNEEVVAEFIDIESNFV